VERERPRDLMKDAAVLKRLNARIDRQLAEGGPEWDVFQNTAREYVLARAEAMLLRERGWDAVALLITGAPAIAIIASGAVVAVRNHMGGLHIHPYRRGTLNHLYADMRKAEEKVLALMEKMKAPAPKNTKETWPRSPPSCGGSRARPGSRVYDDDRGIAMTPAQALDQIIPGWTASLADKYSPDFIITSS
jgi:hypothetical protein